MEEAIDMLQSLCEELARFGLDVNPSQTKTFSTIEVSALPTFVETNVGFIGLLGASQVHKYFGRAFSGELCQRGRAALDHRVACAWAKFCGLHGSLTKKGIHIKLRLKLSDAAMTLAVLYGLASCLLTQTQLTRIDALQRKMVRIMIGWVSQRDIPWRNEAAE